MTPVRTFPLVLVLLLSSALLAGCGVRFRIPNPATSSFKSIIVTGDRTVGATLTGTVTIDQNYRSTSLSPANSARANNS